MADQRHVLPLHRADLHSGRVADLRNQTVEQAATALVDAFVKTGYAEAWVSDVDRTRELVRADCRRRRLKLRTAGSSGRVVLIDEARRDQWLATAAGQEYRRRVDDVVEAALSDLLPSR